MGVVDVDVLDNPAWESLSGPHAAFAETKAENPRAARYPTEMTVFGGLLDPTDDGAWRELAAVIGRGSAALFGVEDLPSGFEVTFEVEGVQMVGEGAAAERDTEAVQLGASDVADMLELVDRTR